MVVKIGFLLVFLLLIQSLEGKKKKQESGITTYVESVGGFFRDAWDGLLGLLPTATKKPSKKNKIPITETITSSENIKKPKKSKKKKSSRKKGWSLDSLMNSAKKNLNSLYNSVTGMFQMRRTKRSFQDGDENESLEDVLDDVLSGVISEFLKEREIQEFKDS